MDNFASTLESPIHGLSDMKFIRLRLEDNGPGPKYPRFENTSERLSSFARWTSCVILPEILARSGFFYSGRDDKVKCFSCGVEMYHWEYDDVPWFEHVRWSPECQFAHLFTAIECGQMINRVKDFCGRFLSECPFALECPTPKFPEYAKTSDRKISFFTWPENTCISPLDLCQAGLYYTGIGDCVRCFDCGAEMKDWERYDSPMVKHKERSPSCSFVQLKERIETVCHKVKQYCERFMVAIQAIQKLMFPKFTDRRPVYPHYENKHKRLNSLQNRSGTQTISPTDLATAGFFYSEHMDCVRCFSCGGTLTGLKEGEIPLLEHARRFPGCAYIQLLDTPDFVKGCKAMGNREFPGIGDGTPMFPEYIPRCERRRSFESVPLTMDPYSLADAGFFYKDRQVRCFSCAGKLKDWQKDTNPWITHARSFPDCVYMQLCQGKGFSVACKRLGNYCKAFIRKVSDVEEISFFRCLLANTMGIRENYVDTILSYFRNQTVEEIVESNLTIPSPNLAASSNCLSSEIQTWYARQQKIEVVAEENRRLRADLLCKVCLHVLLCVVHLPCRHLAVCEMCNERLLAQSELKCVICRARVLDHVRVHFSKCICVSCSG